MQLQVVARVANASPAVASTKVHADEQHHLLVEALGLKTIAGDIGGGSHA